LIQIRFLGGARKSFSADSLTLDCDRLVLEELLDVLQTKKPEGTPDLDVDNILVAVNGADSSAMDGKKTVIGSGDVVSIIPVIHGGAPAEFSIGKTRVAVFPIRGSRALDYGFLDSLRARFPKATIQAVSSKFVLSLSHIEKIIAISLESKKRGILLSDKLETDILLRFASATQISKAISDLGMRPGRDFVVIALGTRFSVEKIGKELRDMADPGILSQKNAGHIRKHFGIPKRQLDSVSSETPLEDILQERASVLF